MFVRPCYWTVLLLWTSYYYSVVVSAYEFGVGKHKITDGARNPILQGFADPSQVTTGVLDDIYARAFLIRHAGATVVLVVMDNWSGTDKIKREVIARVGRTDVTEENLLLTATHSHAATGGYSDWSTYDLLVCVNLFLISTSSQKSSHTHTA